MLNKSNKYRPPVKFYLGECLIYFYNKIIGILHSKVFETMNTNSAVNTPLNQTLAGYPP